MYIVVITYLNGGELGTAVLDSCMFVGLSVLVEMILRNNPQFLYTKLMGLLEIEIIVNLISILVFPEGLYSTTFFKVNYFLGYDNQMINILLPCLLFAMINDITERKFSRTNLFIVISVELVTIVFVWSGASLVVISIILLDSLLFKSA